MNGDIVQIEDGSCIGGVESDDDGKAIGWSDDAESVAVDGELAGRKLQEAPASLDVTVAECAVGGHVEGFYGRIRIELGPGRWQSAGGQLGRGGIGQPRLRLACDWSGEEYNQE